MRILRKKRKKKSPTRNHSVAYPVTVAFWVSTGYFPTTSIGTVMVLGGIQAFWSQAW